MVDKTILKRHEIKPIQWRRVMIRKGVCYGILLFLILTLNACGTKINSPRIDTQNIGKQNNLRITLVRPQRKNVFFYAPPFGYGSGKLNTKIGIQSFLAAQNCFNQIGSTSEETNFAPHIIAYIKQCSCKSIMTTPCQGIVELYWGNGQFIKKYMAKKNVLMMHDAGIYNSYLKIFESITQQILDDNLFKEYFKNGFDDALSSSNPHIPQIPSLSMRPQKHITQKKNASSSLNDSEPPIPPSKLILNYQKKQTLNRHAIAVIIGNRNYKSANKELPNVDYAHNDANAIHQFVTQALGYREGNIILIKDATQADLSSTFGTKDNPKGRLHDWIRPGKSDVFVFYSGHGAPGLNSGEGYLLPVNADPAKVELNGYPLKTLYANLETLPSRSATVVLDACFSGGSAGGILLKNTSSIALKIIETKPKQSKLVVLTASGPSQTASWDTDIHHGLFTRHFLEGISGAADKNDFGNQDGKITLGELKKYLEEEVAYAARRRYGREQTPKIYGNLNHTFGTN